MTKGAESFYADKVSLEYFEIIVKLDKYQEDLERFMNVSTPGMSPVSGRGWPLPMENF
jgi:hypothetical protein